MQDVKDAISELMTVVNKNNLITEALQTLLLQY